jgi:hypothetical protein
MFSWCFMAGAGGTRGLHRAGAHVVVALVVVQSSRGLGAIKHGGMMVLFLLLPTAAPAAAVGLSDNQLRMARAPAAVWWVVSLPRWCVGVWRFMAGAGGILVAGAVQQPVCRVLVACLQCITAG